MTGRIYRFAEFELLPDDAELRTDSSSVRVQEKPLLLLCELLDHPQQLVTRQQLRERMWGSDTFVDYEQGINVAIKKVRSALGDSADNSRFIQTVAKKGYRFVLPVEVQGRTSTASPIAASETTTHAPEPATITLAGRRSLGPRWILAVFIASVLLALGVWLFQFQSAKAHYPAQIHSLAVLPLRNLSPDPGQDYFADGITEDLITNLAQSLSLRVISRTSVMRYRQTGEPIMQIAQELGVDAIVEGAVARSGNRVTVTVQLIDATEDRHLWAQKYDREVDDLLGVEAEVAQEIASQVGGTLRAHESSPPAPRPADPKIYELCLLARYHWNKRTAADLAKAAEYDQQAIALDPQYAPAYAGLANAYALMPSYDSAIEQDIYAKAKVAARHALELDESLAEPHAALGMIALNGPSWKEAGPELRRALNLNPNYASAHHWFAYYLLFSRRGDEAIAEMDVARQLDPLSAVINADEGALLYRVRRYDDARMRLRQAMELAPDFGQPHETMALIDLETGNAVDAIKEARTGLALASTSPRTIGEAGYVLAVTGHTAEARELLATLNNMARRGAVYSAYMALIDIGLRQPDEAVEALEEHSRTVGLQGLSQWHAFDQLAANPRYQKLVARTTDTAVVQIRSPEGHQ